MNPAFVATEDLWPLAIDDLQVPVCSIANDCCVVLRGVVVGTTSGFRATLVILVGDGMEDDSTEESIGIT